MGDRARAVTGHATPLFPVCTMSAVGANDASGCFDAVIKTGSAYWSSTNGNANKYVFDLGFDSSKVSPSGAANIPRSWGSLACAYFGQRATS